MMIARTIALALVCAWTRAVSPVVPLQVVGDNSDCALYLNGPGRTSAYDYSINLLKGNFGYEGQTNCITYEAINQAYLEARNRILVAQPKGDWKAEDFASVGELILDISTNIARRYGLTYEEIEKGLPLIDTSRTLISEVCPPVFSHVECRAGKYRRMDGLCNNLHRPTWGAAMAPFQRLIGPLFSDGINAPRIAHHGRDLPLSRVVSRTMHPDEGFHDHAGTVMVIAWGQFMDHDYTLTGTPLDPKSRNDPEECCNRPPHLKHPYCNEIRIPDDDYFYRLFGVKCIDFVRGFPSPRPGCRLGSRIPFNTLTGAIDGNTVYGVTEKFARKLRTGFGGLLRMNPVFKEYGLKDLLPLKLDVPGEGCTRPNNNMYCFEAGEIRVNEQLVLTVMHTLMAREHNRVANALAEVNPHWDDETLYQEARRINIAEIQHITYNEFLPILLGKDVMEKFGLVLEKKGYWDGYDTNVNPDVIDAFAAAAYRFGHSLLPTAVERWSKAHKFIASKRLSDLIRRPFDLYRAGVLDEYVMGLMNQVAQAMDDSITQEVTNHLFKKVGARFGMDLVSFNMQRGREFGLPGYMEFRKFCGLPQADSFQDLFGSMPNQTVQKYETIFDHPVDVDLWSGGVSERSLPGSMLGPTFACIIATQFSYSRRGDRFWFELPNQPSSFTPEQLTEIRKSRLARVICDNTDIIDTVQVYPMVLPDHELNPRVPCRSGILPQMDFSKWAEPAPFHGSAKQFMTNATVAVRNITKQDDLGNQEKPCTDEKVCKETEVLEKNTEQTNLYSKVGNNTENINTNNTSITGNSTEEHQNLSNKITDQNTVLKYVYKNNDKVELDTKEKGHFKNQLKRRKRSIDDPLSPLASKFQKPALIVNYETSHGPTATVNWSPPLNSANIIKKDDRADFKIISRHNNVNNNEKNTNTLSNFDSSEATHLNEDSNEKINRGPYKYTHSKENTSNESDESSERRDYKEKPSNSAYRQNSEDSYEDRSNNNGNYDNSNESSESYKNQKSVAKSSDSNESEESNERNNYSSSEQPLIVRRENSKYSQAPYSSQSQNGKKKETYNDGSSERSKEDIESSSERYILTTKPYESKPLEVPYSSPHKNSREKPKDNYHDGNSDSSKEDISENSSERYSQNTKPYESKPLEVPYSSPHKNSREKPKDNYHDGNSDSSKEDISENSSERYSQNTKPYESKPLEVPYSFPHKNSREKTKDNYHDDNSESSKEDSENSSERYSQKIKPYESKPLDDTEQNRENHKSKSLESSGENSYKREHDRYREPYTHQHKNNREHTTPSYNRDKHESFIENSNESNEKEINFSKNKVNSKSDLTNKISNASSLPIQDIDLGDFSYERINVNEKGDVVPVKDISENINSNHTTEKNHDILQLVTSIHQPLTNYSDKLIHINDGEVRPVVEINTENDEDSSEINTKHNPNTFDSLEIGVNSDNNHDGNSKILRKGKEIENGDVKQQFERIPLNYNHNQKPQANKDQPIAHKAEEPPKIEYSPDVQDAPKEDIVVTKSEGTIDVFAPGNEKYDENLNFKFDDLQIKLPEIKLPDDILAFTKADSPYEYENNEEDINSRYHYEPHKTGQRSERKDNRDDDDNDNEKDDGVDHKYYGYYDDKNDKKQDYRKKKAEEEENDEDEDLYEKFVRERFGKRGTFERRSERLEQRPLNPQLTETIQNILKKTASIDEQAKQSGDPNAGYMWTLEYGENL